MAEELKIWLSDKRVEYKDDVVLSKFLSSDNSDGYKYSIINLLETDYNGSKINKDLAMKLNGMDFMSFKHSELKDLAKNLGLRWYSSMTKGTLIRQIERVKHQFQG